MKVKIKVGATVGQDHRFFLWNEADKDIVFDVNKFNDSSHKLIKYGYGQITGDGRSYGNGALIVRKGDVIEVDND